MGWLAKILGIFNTRNYGFELPTCSSEEHEAIIRGMWNPVEAKRRAFMESRGLNVEELTRKLLEGIQRVPPASFIGAAGLAGILGWFAMPGLKDLLTHERPEVRSLALELIGKIEDFVDPPTIFEREDRNAYTHAAKIFAKRGALFLKEKHDADKALEYFNRALCLLPGDAVMLSNKASAMGALGKYPEAIECLKQAVALDANNLKYVAVLGEYYGCNGQLVEAQKCFETLDRLGVGGAAERAEHARKLQGNRSRTN